MSTAEAMRMDCCTRAECGWVGEGVLELAPDKVHYGRINCGQCGRFIRWEAKPRENAYRTDEVIRDVTSDIELDEGIILTDAQQHAVDAAVAAIRSDRPIFKIGGYAGTGKTTIMKVIAREFGGMGVCAYTGKAASVLRKKGVGNASTIHSRIYKWDDNEEQFRILPVVNFSGFGIDEASMVGSDIFEDLISYGKPIVAIGDPGQLEPISAKDVNLMAEPDIVLDQIHRQAEGNPIIDLATRIRKDEPFGLMEDERCTVRQIKQFWNSDAIEWADIVICGYNKTRVAINKQKREYLGRDREVLVEGERVICLQNDKTYGVFNGLMFEIERINERAEDRWFCDLRGDDGVMRYNLPIWLGCFHQERAPGWKVTRQFAGNAMIADYGYGITCHKSQGSEWDRVAVISQKADVWDQTRWLYTAVTRAAEQLRLYV